MYLNGIMVKFSKGIGNLEQKMDLEHGSLPKEILMKVTGTKIDSMAKVYLSIVLAHIKGSSKIF